MNFSARRASSLRGVAGRCAGSGWTASRKAPRTSSSIRSDACGSSSIPGSCIPATSHRPQVRAARIRAVGSFDGKQGPDLLVGMATPQRARATASRRAGSTATASIRWGEALMISYSPAGGTYPRDPGAHGTPWSCSTGLAMGMASRLVAAVDAPWMRTPGDRDTDTICIRGVVATATRTPARPLPIWV